MLPHFGTCRASIFRGDVAFSIHRSLSAVRQLRLQLVPIFPPSSSYTLEVAFAFSVAHGGARASTDPGACWHLRSRFHHEQYFKFTALRFNWRASPLGGSDLRK